MVNGGFTVVSSGFTISLVVRLIVFSSRFSVDLVICLLVVISSGLTVVNIFFY